MEKLCGMRVVRDDGFVAEETELVRVGKDHYVRRYEGAVVWYKAEKVDGSMWNLLNDAYKSAATVGENSLG